MRITKHRSLSSSALASPFLINYFDLIAFPMQAHYNEGKKASFFITFHHMISVEMQISIIIIIITIINIIIVLVNYSFFVLKKGSVAHFFILFFRNIRSTSVQRKTRVILWGVCVWTD